MKRKITIRNVFTEQVIDHEEIVQTAEPLENIGSSSGSDSGSNSDVSSNHEGDKEDEVSGTVKDSLDPTLREKIGIIPELEQREVPRFYEELKLSWDYWMVNGLKASEKEDLVKSYSIPELCDWSAPVLNLEISSAQNFPEMAKYRDKHLAASQSCLGAAMTAIGSGLSILFDSDGEVDSDQLIKYLCDAGRLCADLYHQQSVSRRALILPKITDKKYRKMLEETKIDRSLFGEELGKKVKSSQALAKTGLELFAPTQSKKLGTNSSNSGNARGLSNRSRGRYQQATYRKGAPPKTFRLSNQSRFGQQNYSQRTYIQRGSNSNRRNGVLSNQQSTQNQKTV